MSVFAGIVSFDPELPITTAQRTGLAGALTRREHAEVRAKAGAYAHFVATASDARNSTSVSDTGQFTLLSGEPYFADGETDGHALIDQALRENDAKLLKSARGTFCAATYAEAHGALTLAVDRFGVHPLYVWIGPRIVVFATALRILEAVDFVPKLIDPRGLAECVSFGFPLADRSPYRNIFVLRAAERCVIEQGRPLRECYFDWNGLAEVDPADAPRQAHALFKEAVRLRLRGAHSAITYLSGGMDSRAIVAILREQKAEVRCFNYSPLNSQDECFARLFADACGARFTNNPILYDGNTDWSALMATSLHTSGIEPNSAEGHSVWSGDGGSVSVGSVYLRQGMLDAMRQGDKAAAIARFISHNRLDFPARIFTRQTLSELGNFITRGISEELEHINCDDPALALHLFLMFNDQRRHLARHFENMDLHGITFHLPFYDARFLEYVFSIPLDYRLAHRFYSDWFTLFPESTRSVPWQTYPGHQPCPVPTPTGLEYQWSKATPSPDPRRRARAVVIRKRLRAPWFPHNHIDRGKLLLASWLHQIGLRDCSPALRAAEIWVRHAEISGPPT